MAITGDLDEDREPALIEQPHGTREPGYQAPQIPAEPEQRQGRQRTQPGHP